MYTQPLAKALGDLLVAQNNLNLVLRELPKKDIEKVMNDSGYFDRYISTKFELKNEATNRFKYEITYRDGNETHIGYVYIWWDGSKMCGDY